MLTREEIARRAAKEIIGGQYVNLGIGLPTLIPAFIRDEVDAFFQSENGILGVGPYPFSDEVDPDLINAGKETVSVVAGASFFDSSMSFGMIRSGRIDLAIMGGMQVSERGDLANWVVPGSIIKGMGGAMDLVHGAKRVIIAMEHLTREGEPKIVRECSLPLTGRRVVDLIITDRAVMEIIDGALILCEIASGLSVGELVDCTDAPLRIAPSLKEIDPY
jgi:3-oxoacid CoA-transferase subunit B